MCSKNCLLRVRIQMRGERHCGAEISARNRWAIAHFIQSLFAANNITIKKKKISCIIYFI